MITLLTLGLHLDSRMQEREEAVRALPKVIDLAAHWQLLALLGELRRCSGRVRELRRSSNAVTAQLS